MNSYQHSFLCDHTWIDDIYYVSCTICNGLGSVFEEDNDGNLNIFNCSSCSSQGKIPKHRLICTNCGEIDG